MPVKHSIWRVGDDPKPLEISRLPDEKTLERMIIQSPAILSSEWMLIGQQERTGFGGLLDLIAIAPDGSLVLIELKRGRTPREVVAQALDYASWVETLSADKILHIYSRFSKNGNLTEDFKKRFGSDLDEESLNQSHQIILVASELDDATERIINYLNARDIAINVIFFQVFKHGDDRFLSRAWLIDPGETQINVANTARSKGPKEPWNGEYYVSFGDPSSRNWDDARQYGYICAGGGTWYTQTLRQLSVGDRIWVNVPQNGYVGVGIVEETVQDVLEFKVQTPEGEKPVVDVVRHGPKYKEWAHNSDVAERFVRVKWLDSVPLSQAIRELNFFGNQNTVCRPVTPQWRETVERLKARFKNWDSEPPSG